MKTTPLRVEEWISDVAFFFLVALTALAVLNYISIWVVAGCFGFYILIGILIACLLPKLQGTRGKQMGSGGPGSTFG